MITLTFWGNLNSKDTFIEELYRSLGDLTVSKKSDATNSFYTLKDSTTITLGTPESASTQEKFQSLLKDLTDYFHKIPTDKPLVKSSVIERLSGVTMMFGIAFQDTKDRGRLDRIIGSILLTTGIFDGVVLLANRDLIDGNGSMIFSHEGKSDYDENDILRFSKSKEILAEQSIKIIPKNSFELKKSECNLRGIDDICKRILALFEVSVYSHCMLDNNLGQLVALQRLGDLNDKYNSLRYVTKLELEYLNSTDFNPAFGESFLGRFESLATLFWCIGLIADLGEPFQICDRQKLSDFLYNFESIEKIIICSNVRDISDLLQLQDLTMRYYLACVDDNSTPLNFNVVRERLIALNWVLTTKFGADWDDVVNKK